MNKSMIAYDSNGNTLARDNLVLAYFSKRPFEEIVLSVKDIFESWLGIIPKEALSWALVGKNATKYTKVTPKTLSRCLLLLHKDIAQKKNVYFELMGPQSSGPDYRVIVKGFTNPKKIAFADETNLIELVFPRDFCSSFGEDRFVEFAASLFNILSCDSGYASPALQYGSRGNYKGIDHFLSPLALHHHGFDVSNNVSTTIRMGSKCRGARWITMLSTKIVNDLGGLGSLKSSLVEGVEVKKLSGGILIRAGKVPEMGDVNHRKLTPLISSVAHAIEKVSYFHDDSLLPLFDHDEDKRDRWERRFWWDEELV